MRSGVLAWEYLFPIFGGRPPWISALSQATAVQALTRAAAKLGRPDLLSIAGAAAGAFAFPPPAGVRVALGRGAVWFVLYSFAPRQRVLNAHLDALAALFDFAQASGDPHTKAAYDAGLLAAHRRIRGVRHRRVVEVREPGRARRPQLPRAQHDRSRARCASAPATRRICRRRRARSRASSSAAARAWTRSRRRAMPSEPPRGPGRRAPRRASPARRSPGRSRSAPTPRCCATSCASARGSSSSARSSTSRSGRARVYFELRDGEGAVPCAMWRDAFDRLGLPEGTLTDGAQVVVAGGPDYYPGSRTSSPSFSFDVTGLRVAGDGDLLAQVDALRRRLAAEGLLEPQKRLARPRLPRCIGVVTGEGGKARGDVLAGLERRGWAGRVVWAFAPVQDRRAAPAITRALTDLAALAEVEVIVVARGGGSLADLFAFCDETLCRTVAMLRVPVISSVGHHADRTLIDDVAAVACSTPTHAAETAVPLHCGEARAALARGDAGSRATPTGARHRAACRPRRRLARHARRAVVTARASSRRCRARRASTSPASAAALHQTLREMRASATRRARARARGGRAGGPRRSSAARPPRRAGRRRRGAAALDVARARARRARPRARRRARLRRRRRPRGQR